ncbi:MAG TPA: ArsR family transcriptional regulator [Gemmatimonadales bacterium]|nr:ArsR family transcriptional regulator [Gemmatimonadales bacterium]
MPNWLEKLTGDTQIRLLSLLRRAPRTITELAAELGLTDNGVRGHIAALERDGIVEDVGAQRDTGGKPARRYGLTREGEELFPKAYAPVLGGLIAELVRHQGSRRAAHLLRAVGARFAEGAVVAGDAAERVAAGARLLQELGGDVEVRRTGKGWHIQGYGCPLSAVTANHPEACRLVEALLERVTGLPVSQRCELGERPRCAFAVARKGG